MEFLDLGTDCLHDICDRLDIATLCAVAGTCHRMWDIARSSFVRRKITKFSYDHWQAEEHEYRTENSAEFVKMLIAFGDLITGVRVRFKDDCDEKIKIFNEVVLRCGGTLRLLEYYDADTAKWDFDQLVDATPLFANLTHLELRYWCDFGAIPWPACQELTTLKIGQKDEDGASFPRTYLGHTFPKLKSFELSDYKDPAFIPQADFDNFVRRHSQLTHITVEGYKLSFAVLTELPNLESITIDSEDDDDCIMSLVGLQRPKLIRLGPWIEDSAKIMDFVNLLAARETLEELDFGIPDRPTNTTAFWQCLGQLRGLRVLKLRIITSGDREWADSIEVLVRYLTSIARVKIARCVDEEFEMHAYNRLDALCHRRNIAVDVAVKSHCINAEDLPRFSKWAHWRTIRFGRCD